MPLGIKKRWVDRVAVLHSVARSHHAYIMELEARRFWIERLVPHHFDFAGMSAGHAAATHGISHVVPISDLDHIRRNAASGAHSPAVPRVAVVGNQPAATSAERVV